MAVTYEKVLRAAALRVNALVGATAAALETSYATSPLTSAQFDSADFPFTAFKDGALSVESKLANAIANVGNHPWRSVLASTTATITHGNVIPAVDVDTVPIIGVLGSVYDGSDGTVCTEMALDDIRIAKRNANSWLLAPVYGYKIDGRRIFHTRTNVKIDVCIYNRAARETAIGTLTNQILLPEVLEEAYVCGIVSMLVRDDAFTGQAAIYRGYFNDALASIAQGLTSVVSKVIPVPTMAAA